MKLCQISAPVKSSEIPFQLEDEVSGSLKQPALIAGNAKTLLKEHCSERPRKVLFARKWSWKACLGNCNETARLKQCWISWSPQEFSGRPRSRPEKTMSQRLLSLFEKLLYFFLHLTCIRLKIKDLVTVTCLVPPEAQERAEEWAPSHKRRIKLGGLERDCWCDSSRGELQPHI